MLSMLKLSGVFLGIDSIRSIATGMIKCCSLALLDMSHCELNEEGFGILSDALPQVEEKNKIGEQKFKDFNNFVVLVTNKSFENSHRNIYLDLSI